MRDSSGGAARGSEPGERRVALLVDDEPALLKTAQRMFEQRGFSVFTAPDAGSALELVAGGRFFDVLVTDVVLRGVSGPELARRVRRELPDLRVLFVSGFDVASSGVELASDGSDAFLAKPYTASELDDRLRDLLSYPSVSPPASSGVTARDRLR